MDISKYIEICRLDGRKNDEFINLAHWENVEVSRFHVVGFLVSSKDANKNKIWKGFKTCWRSAKFKKFAKVGIKVKYELDP